MTEARPSRWRLPAPPRLRLVVRAFCCAWVSEVAYQFLAPEQQAALGLPARGKPGPRPKRRPGGGEETAPE